MTCTCGTCEQLVDWLESALKEFTPRELAQLRVELRKSAGLPQQPEPDLYVN